MDIKRVNIKGKNGLYYEDYILIENLEDLMNYEEKVYGKVVELAGSQICAKIQNKDFELNPLVSRLEETANSIGCGSLWLLGDTAIKVQNARLKYVAKGYTIAINKNGGWMLVGEGDVIEHIKYVYTEEDINVTKFEGGRHYYASVKGIEVIDEDGDRKWNTWNYANEVAKRFMNKLNEENEV